MTNPDRDTLGAAGVRPLGDFPDLEIADGDADVRGWRVSDRNGRELGRVEELLVDPRAMRVQYLEVAVADGGRRVLLPVERTSLDRDERTVLAPSAELVAALPAYDASGIGEEHARLTSEAYDRDATITRTEEELAIGTRAVPAGQLNIRKRVETEHVREAVPVTREEVTVERRPVSADRATNGVEIGDDEIRIPVIEERVVVEKRPVVTEEIVVRTSTVTENQVVEADLRKERVQIDEHTDARTDVRTDIPRDRA